MDEYEPFTRGLSTRLERELERLSLPGQVELSTLVKKDEAREQVAREGYLFHLDRNTKVDAVIEQIRRAGASGAFTRDDHHGSSDDDSDEEEHARSRHVALRNQLRRKQAHRDRAPSSGGSSGGAESNPESGYDSDKSEEQVLEKDSISERPGSYGRRQGRKLSSIKLRALSREDLDEHPADEESAPLPAFSKPSVPPRYNLTGAVSGLSRFLPNLSSSSTADAVEMQPMRKSSAAGSDYVVDLDPDSINIDDDDWSPTSAAGGDVPTSRQNKPPFDEYDIDDSDREDDETRSPDKEKIREKMAELERQYGLRLEPNVQTRQQPVAAPSGRNTNMPPHQTNGVFIEDDDYDYNIEDDDYDDMKKEKLLAKVNASKMERENHLAQQQPQQQQRGHFPTLNRSNTFSRSLSFSNRSTSRNGLSTTPPAPKQIFTQTGNRVDVEKASAQLRTAISEFYRGLVLLQNFATLNVEATEKILKKHDKNIELGAREKFTQSHLAQFSFYRRRSLKALLRETEHVFAVCFTEGHRTQAMKVLRVPTEKKSVGVATFRFGFFGGISIALFLVCLYLTTVLDTRLLDKMRPGLIVYRMLSVMVLMLWYWGVDMWVWTKHRVNYVFIFEFNPRRHVRYQHIFEAAAIFTFFLVSSLLLYMLTAAQDGVFGWEIPGFTWLEMVPPHLIPLSLLIVVVFLVLWIQIKSTFWLLRTLCRIVAAPFVPVVFRDFFIGDQILSMVIALQDLEYVICYYSTDAWTGKSACFGHQFWVFPLIAALPVLWRLLQCLRRYRDTRDYHQLINAGKYGTALLVTASSAVRRAKPMAYTDVIWFLCVFAGTVYSFVWDVIKDWSLGSISNVRHKFLRSELLYPTAWYYTALIMNLGMRLMWTLTISPEAVRGTLHPDLFAYVLALVEMTRRAVWNMFRLENEQLNNCGKFRAIKEVPLPLPTSEE
eukprot:TRINITY_DN581_c0_g1_i1.p1 TRINITY_DN581_c0_g1~~TRINITY_DN581_c0_g1_i1.p1  ORF type:complete len:942 (+),score=153.67 TRINITY_DN581_c0_g1_i1:915-3740(+)